VKRLFPIIAMLAIATPAAAEDVGELARIAFADGSAKLAVEPDDLAPIVAWAVAHPRGLVVIDGHAQTPRLALERARAVRSRLVAAGVNPMQIVLAVFRDDAPSVVWAAPH
jgi:outer membrane protein OmpA-like peptidoglycan-associated protein